MVASSSVSIRVHPWLLPREASREPVTTDRVLNRRPGSSVRFAAQFLIRAIREICGEKRRAIRNSPRPSWFRKIRGRQPRLHQDRRWRSSFAPPARLGGLPIDGPRQGFSARRGIRVTRTKRARKRSSSISRTGGGIRSTIFSTGGSGPVSASSGSSAAVGFGAGNSPRDLASARKADSAAASGQPDSSEDAGTDVFEGREAEAVAADSALTASGSTGATGAETTASVSMEGATAAATEAPARRRSNSSIRPFFFRRRPPRAPRRQGKRVPSAGYRSPGHGWPRRPSVR